MGWTEEWTYLFSLFYRYGMILDLLPYLLISRLSDTFSLGSDWWWGIVEGDGMMMRLTLRFVNGV